MPEPKDKPTHWGVLGGGMLGLTLAHRLAQAGHRVTLVEGSPDLGGLTSAWEVGGVVWDRYYHVTLLSDFNLRSLLAELDLEREIQWRVTRTNFFTGSGLYPLNNAVDFLRLPHLGWLDKARLAMTILYGSRIENGRALENHPVEEWLVRLSGRRTFEKLWQPLLRAKLGTNHSKVSAAFIWAVIRRFYAARRGGLKTEMFGYVPGGYGRIVKALGRHIERNGVQVKAGYPVTEIRRAGAALRVQTDKGGFDFDRIAVTFATPLAARVCKDLPDDERTRLTDISYQGIVCASLLLKKPLGGAYLTYITDETIPFTAVVEMSSLIDGKETGDQYLVYLPRYLPSDDPFFEQADDVVEEEFRSGLLRMFPELRPGDIAAFRISRTRHVLALSTLNYSSHLPPMTTSVPGLSIVNSAHIINGALTVNETVGLANKAAEFLLAADRPLR